MPNPFEKFGFAEDVPASEQSAAAENPFAKFGFDEAPAPEARPERTVMGTLGDAGVATAKGLVGLAQSGVGLYDLATHQNLGKSLDTLGVDLNSAKDYWDSKYSDAQQESNQAVHEAKGFTNTLTALKDNPSVIATTVGESLPQMIGGGIIGGALRKGGAAVAPYVAGAIGEGSMSAGSAAEQIRSKAEGGVLNPAQQLAAVATGITTAGIGAAGGKIASKFGGDIDTVFAGGVDAVRNWLLPKIVASGVTEGAEELAQSSAEQAIQNYALGRPLDEGVPEAAAIGLAAGLAAGTTGSAVNTVRDRMQQRDLPSQTEEQLLQDAPQQNISSGAITDLPQPLQNSSIYGDDPIASQPEPQPQTQELHKTADEIEGDLLTAEDIDTQIAALMGDFDSLRSRGALPAPNTVVPPDTSFAVTPSGVVAPRIAAEQLQASDAAVVGDTPDAAMNHPAFAGADSRNIIDRQNPLASQEAVQPPESDLYKIRQDAAAERAKNMRLSQILPQGFDDPRLARDEYRQSLEGLGEQLTKGGDIGYTRDANDNINGRTSSINPEWFKGMNEDKDHSMSVEDTQAAIKKALAGEKLGVRQTRVVKRILDEVSGIRSNYAGHLKEQRQEARRARQEALKSFWDEMPDTGNDPFGIHQENVAELFNEDNYEPDASYDDRSIAEMASKAESMGADWRAVDKALESGDSAQSIQALSQLIYGLRNEHRPAETTRTETGREAAGDIQPRNSAATIAGMEGEPTNTAQLPEYQTGEIAPTVKDSLTVDPVVNQSLTAEGIDSAAHEAATSPNNDLPEPTQAQKEAGNYRHGHLRLHGLDIAIENPHGSTRSGVDKNGKAWQSTMDGHYGYVKSTTGADGDAVDVFIGKKPESDKVFVIDQYHADGSFDEHKAILGASSMLEAKSLYKRNYQKGWKVGPTTAMSVDEFKSWLKDGDTTKPISESGKPNSVLGEPDSGSGKPSTSLFDEPQSLGDLSVKHRQESSASILPQPNNGADSSDNLVRGEKSASKEQRNEPAADAQSKEGNNKKILPPAYDPKDIDVIANEAATSSKKVDAKTEGNPSDGGATENMAAVQILKNAQQFNGKYHGKSLAPMAVSMAQAYLSKRRRLTADELNQIAIEHGLPKDFIAQFTGNAWTWDWVLGRAQNSDSEIGRAARELIDGPPSEKPNLDNKKSNLDTPAEAEKPKSGHQKSKVTEPIKKDSGSLFDDGSNNGDNNLNQDAENYHVGTSGSIQSGLSSNGGISDPETDAGRGDQLELFLPPGTDKKQDFADLFGTIVTARPVTEIRAAHNNVKSLRDLAQLLVSIRKDPQESFYAVVADHNGTVLRVMQYTRGTSNASSAYPLDVVAEAASIDNAAVLHLAHNHPSGKVDASSADERITKKIFSMLDGTGIKPGHHAIIGKDQYGDGSKVNSYEGGLLRPVLRPATIKITQRRFVKRGTLGAAISSPKSARDVTKNHDNALFLLNNQNEPVAIIPLSAQEMMQLRKSGSVNRILSAISKSNANQAIIKTSDEDAAMNLAGMINGLEDIKVLDWIDGNGASDRGRGGNIYDWSGSFFSLSEKSAATPISQNEVQSIIDRVSANFGAKLKITPVASAVELPPEVLDNMQKQKIAGEKVRGVYHGGRIFINREAMQSSADVEATILHELAHDGLAKMFGQDISKKMTALFFAIGGNKGLNDLLGKYNVPVDRYSEALADIPFADRSAIMTEELLAHIAQDESYLEGKTGLKGKIADFVLAVKTWLRLHGFLQSSTMGEDEIFALLRRVRRYSGNVSQDGTDIRYSLAGDESAQPSDGISISGTEERKIFGIPTDTIIRKLQDKMRPLLTTQRAVKNAGGSIEENEDAYLAEELFHGKTENDLRKMKERFIDRLTKKMADNKIERSELDLYLWARHAEERNIQIAKINPEMPDGGSGMTTAQANEVLRKFSTEGRTAALKDAAKVVYDMLAEKRLIVRHGLADDATVDTWENVYQNYVPLKGYAKNEGGTRARTGRGFDIRGNESMRALGRRTMPESPVLHSVRDLTESIIRFRKNEVGNAFLNLIQANPDPDYWQVFDSTDPEFERKLLKSEGREVVGNARVTDKNKYFITKKNGKEYWIKLEDDLLLRAMQNMGPEKLNGFFRVMAKATRFLSSMVTQYNPEFLITNFQRDIQAAIINLQAEIDLHDGKVRGKQITGAMIKGIAPAMRAAHRGLRGKPFTDGPMKEWSKAFDDFRNAGGATGWYQVKDVDELAKELSGLVNMQKKTFAGGAARTGRAISEFVSNANGAVENATRLSVYKAAVDAGISQQRAASLAKNLTVNFNRKGEVGTAINSLYMFFNASVQGTASLARALGTLKIDADGKRHLNMSQKIVIGLMGASFALALLNRGAGGDDDDGEAWWDKVPNAVKERNLVIMKSVFGFEPNGEYIKIPLPYGYNVFHAIANNIESAIAGKKGIGEASASVFKSMLGAFSPIGVSESDSLGGTVSRTITPTVFKPFSDLAANENFFGGRIFSENMPFDVPKPDSQLSMRSTAEPWKWLAKFMNEATGGSAFRSGTIDISPDKMGYIFNYFTGGAGQFVSGVLNTGVKTYQDREMDATEIPFARKVVGKTSPYKDQNTFYERKKEIDQLHDELKSMPMGSAERQEFAAEYKDKLGLSMKLKFTAKELSRLRKKRSAILDDEELTDKEKDEKTKPIEDKMKEKVDAFNKAYGKSA